MRPGILLASFLAAGTVDGAELVRREGAGFVAGGAPFPAVGVNCYYLMVYSAGGGLRDTVNEVLDNAVALGATVVRTWAFNDGASQWNALQTAPGAYSENVFRGLDYVVKRAGEKGLRLLLPLVNNWDDYGGMNQYVEWSTGASTHDDFYTDPDTKRWYKDHATRVLTRVNTLTGVAYRDDPAIFGWELANEPRAQSQGAAALDAWIAEMAAHIKAIDPNHLLSTGSEGFYRAGRAAKNPRSWMASEGVDFIANHAHEDIDFASFHVYADSWSLSNAESVKWLRDHVDDARNELGKPVLLGEMGKLQPIDARNEHFLAMYDALLGEIEPGVSGAGVLLWILYHNSYPDYDGFGIYLPSPAHAGTKAMIQEKSAELRQAVSRQPPLYLRSDSNCDGRLDTADAITTLENLFKGAPLECCSEAADANGDGEIDVSDPIYGLLYAYLGGPPPPPPFPECGASPACDAPAAGCAA